MHPVTFLERPAAFHLEEEAVGPEHPAVGPVFQAVAEPELPVARLRDSLARPQPEEHLAEVAVAGRASAVVEQTQSARSC